MKATGGRCESLQDHPLATVYTKDMVKEGEFDWIACLALVHKKDQIASRQMVEVLYPQVARIIQNHLPRAASVEDIAQDVFLKIFTRLHQYKGDVPFPHWVGKITVTTCIDHLRAQKRKPEFRLADLSEPMAGLIEENHAADQASNPHELNQIKEVVNRLLEQLDPVDRAIIRLLDIEERSLADVSQLTNTNVTLVKVRAFRARKKLQKILKYTKL